MNVTDYTTNQLKESLDKYIGYLKSAEYGDKRRKQTKQDIIFNRAMVTLFRAELSKRVA